MTHMENFEQSIAGRAFTEEERALLPEAIATLTERQQNALRRWLGIGFPEMSYREIANDVGHDPTNAQYAVESGIKRLFFWFTRKLNLADNPENPRLDQLGLTARIPHCLSRRGMKHVSDLSGKDLKQIRGFGEASFRELVEALEAKGLVVPGLHFGDATIGSDTPERT